MYVPIRDDEVPAVVALMNRVYRGTGAADWSNEPRYLAGDRTTTDILLADLAAKPAASLLKWVEDGWISLAAAYGSSLLATTHGIWDL